MGVAQDLLLWILLWGLVICGIASFFTMAVSLGLLAANWFKSKRNKKNKSRQAMWFKVLAISLAIFIVAVYLLGLFGLWDGFLLVYYCDTIGKIFHDVNCNYSIF